MSSITSFLTFVMFVFIVAKISLKRFSLLFATFFSLSSLSRFLPFSIFLPILLFRHHEVHFHPALCQFHVCQFMVHIIFGILLIPSLTSAFSSRNLVIVDIVDIAFDKVSRISQIASNVFSIFYNNWIFF
jgi:hypothetical protein